MATIFAALQRVHEAQRDGSTSGDLLYEIAGGFERAILNRASPGEGTSYSLYGSSHNLGHFETQEGDFDMAKIEEGFAGVKRKLEEAQADYKALLDATASQIRERGALDRWKLRNEKSAQFVKKLEEKEARKAARWAAKQEEKGASPAKRSRK